MLDGLVRRSGPSVRYDYPRKAEMREAAIAMGKTLAKEGVEVRMLASSPPRGWPELTRSSSRRARVLRARAGAPPTHAPTK